MLISLRVLISSVLGALVLGIAMLTFFLVFNVSVSSIRSLALIHAQQVSAHAADQISSAVGEVTSALLNLQNVTTAGFGENYTMPDDDPNGFEAGCMKWFTLALSMISSTHYTSWIPLFRFASWSILQPVFDPVEFPGNNYVRASCTTLAMNCSWNTDPTHPMDGDPL